MSCGALLNHAGIRNTGICNKCYLVRPHEKQMNFGDLYGCKENFPFSSKIPWNYIIPLNQTHHIGIYSSKFPLFFLRSNYPLSWSLWPFALVYKLAFPRFDLCSNFLQVRSTIQGHFRFFKKSILKQQIIVYQICKQYLNK